MKHLLTCECGREHGISPSQAGQEIACECGRAVQAPRLRELRSLPPYADDSFAPTKPQWSSQKGWLFVVGLLLSIVGAFMTFNFAYMKGEIQNYVDPVDMDPTVMNEHIDLLPPEQSLELWKEIQEGGLQRPGPPIHVQAREALEKNQRYLIVSAAALALGIGMLIAAFVLKPPPPR